MVEVSQADYEYFNGSIVQHATESSVLISSSKYLNNAPLRALIAQEMLRRNGPDMPNTAFIPEVAQILHNLEDMPAIFRLFEEEKARLPEFRDWLDRRVLSDFKVEDVKHCKPGTLGHVIHDFLANSGYQMDYFFQGMKVDSDYTFYLKERTFTHDIEHMVTGLCPSQVGEIALIAVNTMANANYFSTEFAHELNLYGVVLMSTSLSRSGLHYPRTLPALLEGLSRGYALGAKQKKPLFMIRWEDHLDRQLSDIRAEFGFEDGPAPGYWDWVFQEFKG